MEQLRTFLFKKYSYTYAQSKVLNFTKGFLKYQAKLTLDPRYLAFDMFLEKPKVRKIRKKMTGRVVTKEDIEHVLTVIKAEMLKGHLTKHVPGSLSELSYLAPLRASDHTAQSNS